MINLLNNTIIQDIEPEVMLILKVVYEFIFPSFIYSSTLSFIESEYFDKL